MWQILIFTGTNWLLFETLHPIITIIMHLSKHLGIIQAFKKCQFLDIPLTFNDILSHPNKAKTYSPPSPHITASLFSHSLNHSASPFSLFSFLSQMTTADWVTTVGWKPRFWICMTNDIWVLTSMAPTRTTWLPGSNWLIWCSNALMQTIMV